MRPQGPGQNDPRLGTKRPRVRDKTTQGPGQNDPGSGTKRPRGWETRPRNGFWVSAGSNPWNPRNPRPFLNIQMVLVVLILLWTRKQISILLMSYKLQSVLVPKNKFTQTQAITFVKNNFQYKKLDVNQRVNYYSFRQLEPDYLKREGYTKYVEKRLPNGVLLVIAYKT